MVIVTELELLPGSSSSSPPNHDHNHRYEVFLSFRGVDTRMSFTDHLYNALLDADITTFLDDEEIETGEPLKPELESAIKSSRASVIVLSKNYASSTWCLDELVLILEQKRNFSQIVIPIFYHVEPTHVRKQQSSFEEAMAKHKQRMEDETDAEKRRELAQKIELWKKALTDVSDLKGKDSNGRKETEIIKEVINDIHHRLGVPLSNTWPRLIGMNRYIESIGSWLTDGSSHIVDILTIIGMGGIGKTSLAKYVFQLHSGKFYKSRFIEGINARCNERFDELTDLQKQLHGVVSKRFSLQVNEVSTKVLIVLDDIGSIDQLDALLGNKGLPPGSKIIITTKDASLTERCALFKSQLHPRHVKVLLEGLYEYASLRLLCIHAFESHTLEEGYEEVSEKLVKYCEGHPLALEVLGKLLQKRDVAYWEDCLKGLKKEPHPSIKEVFQMSFYSLPSNEMELFKHIACFFVGKDRDFTETILNACDLEARYGIMNLIDKCLLSIDDDYNYLMMHSLIQDMGRDLVRQESLMIPGKRSRLWCHEESFNVLKHKKGSENILGLALDMRMLDKKKLRGSFELKTKSFTHMNNLMLLQLSYVELNGFFGDFPEELRWLCLHGSPLKSIPLDLSMEYLVALDMSYSNIESFDMSKDNRLLESLKILNLSFCQHLHYVGGFLKLPALERLIVRECISLIEVCESVEHCVELVHIDLSYCYKLKKVPISISKLKKVKTLLLDSREFEIDTMQRDLKLIAVFLPSSLRVLSLKYNSLFNESFPKDFSRLSMLEKLCLDGNPIVSMPDCVRSLPRLKKLSMCKCDMMISVERPPNTLRRLWIESDSLRKIKFDPEMSPLNLDVSCRQCPPSLEIDGLWKIQAMAGVEEKVLHKLGWKNLDFIKEKLLTVVRFAGNPIECQPQMMYYEYGIFSTLYWGNEMPSWIEYRSEGQLIKFTIPSSSNKLRGLNVCFIVKKCDADEYVYVPRIEIGNITKNQTWVYYHYIEKVNIEGECLSMLSHWMFGPNEMKGGDRVQIDIGRQRARYEWEFGISLVYEEDGKIEEEEEEEDVLSYYKSWNHIIGGDLSNQLVRTGEYILGNKVFGISTEYQGNFKAFSQKESLTTYQGMNTETKQVSKGKVVLSDPVNSKGGLRFKRENLEVGSSSENTEKRQKIVESPCASDAAVNSTGCNDKC